MTLLPYETQRPIVSDNIFAVVVYLLYGLGYFTGISVLIGVIIAHVKVDEDDTDPVLRSHYRSKSGLSGSDCCTSRSAFRCPWC